MVKKPPTSKWSPPGRPATVLFRWAWLSKLSITKILFRSSNIPNKNFSFLNFLTRGHRPDQYFLGDENLWRVFIEQKNMGHRAQQTKRCPLSQHSFSRPGSLSRIFHRHRSRAAKTALSLYFMLTLCILNIRHFGHNLSQPWASKTSRLLRLCIHTLYLHSRRAI